MQQVLGLISLCYVIRSYDVTRSSDLMIPRSVSLTCLAENARLFTTAVHYNVDAHKLQSTILPVVASRFVLFLTMIA